MSNDVSIVDNSKPDSQPSFCAGCTFDLPRDYDLSGTVYTVAQLPKPWEAIARQGGLAAYWEALTPTPAPPPPPPPEPEPDLPGTPLQWQIDLQKQKELNSQQAWANVQTGAQKAKAKRLLKQDELAVRREEVDHRRERMARERGRWTEQDTGTTGDDVKTFEELAAVFGEEVDLTEASAILQRNDGGLVLPAQKLNWIYGLPGTGKSQIALITLIEAVMRGGRAIYLDYEDTARTFHQRCAVMGFSPMVYEDSFKYVHGGLSEFPAAQAGALAWLAEAVNPEMNLVVIDAAESSGCPSDGAPVNTWLEKVVMPWYDAGYTTNVTDHIPKAREGRADGPIGSQRKLAAVTGISLLVGGYCWTKRKNGRITLTNDKDRTGSYGKKEPVATIIGDWVNGAFGYTIAPPSNEDSRGGSVGNAILEAVNDAGPAGMVGKRKLLEAVGGNRAIANTTIDNMVEGGLIQIAKKGQTITYTLTAEGASFLED